MSSLKNTPIKYSEYVEWFEELEEIRKVWHAYFFNLAKEMKKKEDDWDPKLGPLPVPNALPTSSQGLYALAEDLATPLKNVFGTDYKKNKVKKINDSKGIIIVRNNDDDEIYYAGIANNITLSNSEKTYKVLIQNKGCDCMGFGINTEDTFTLDAVWPSNSHSLTKCASKATLSGYKWYRAKPLNTEHSALFGHSIIDLLQTIKNTQIYYNIDADPDLGTDINLTTVLGRPIKYNIQAVLGLDVNYDLLKDKEISVDCSCDNSCVEDPIILLNKEKTAIIRQGLKVKGPYLITITPKLKHWKWASNICFNIAANAVPVTIHKLPNCGGCTQHHQQCTTSDIDCCFSEFEYDSCIVDGGGPGENYCACRARCFCDENCRCDCVQLVMKNYHSDCNYFSGKGTCHSKTSFNNHRAFDVNPRHCAKSYVRTRNTNLSCGLSSLAVTPTTTGAAGCKEQNKDCKPMAWVKRRLCPVLSTSPIVYVPEVSYIAIQTAPLLTGIHFLYKMCVADALSIIRGIVSLPGIKTTPTTLFFNKSSEAPSSMVACDAAGDLGESITLDGGCRGVSLVWHSAYDVRNLCCNTATNNANGTVSNSAPNLIIPNEPCRGYNTLKLSEDTQIRFKV